MTGKSTIGSKIGLGPYIAAPNQSIQVMDSQTIYLTNIAKKIINKTPQGKGKIGWKWNVIV